MKRVLSPLTILISLYHRPQVSHTTPVPAVHICQPPRLRTIARPLSAVKTVSHRVVPVRPCAILKMMMMRQSAASPLPSSVQIQSTSHYQRFRSKTLPTLDNRKSPRGKARPTQIWKPKTKYKSLCPLPRIRSLITLKTNELMWITLRP